MENEKGITLIEILAAITILSIVGVIIWNVFIQGTNYSGQEMTKNQLNQEANIVVTKIKNNYQSLDEFKLTSNNCSINIYDSHTLVKDPTETFGNEGADICYELKNDDNHSIAEVILEPKSVGTYNNIINLKVYDTNNSVNEVIIPFRLSRLKKE